MKRKTEEREQEEIARDRLRGLVLCEQRDDRHRKTEVCGNDAANDEGYVKPIDRQHKVHLHRCAGAALGGRQCYTKGV